LHKITFIDAIPNTAPNDDSKIRKAQPAVKVNQRYGGGPVSNKQKCPVLDIKAGD
jgi:hypothetical protein